MPLRFLPDFSKVALLSIATALTICSDLHAEGSIVKIDKKPDGSFQLLCNGEPFFINGAGGTKNLAMLKASGGNSIRTWGIETMAETVDGKPVLDRALELGLTVTVGIWIGHERHGFDYGDAAKVKKQRDDVLAAVRKYKNHPAVLMWGLGNEMEGPTSSTGTVRIWKELNVLADIIHKEDPNHPVMSVIASASPDKVKGIMENYPSIDVLGVNAYAGASGAGRSLKETGWTKPFVLTEFGPMGHWEVPKTKWGEPIEPSSSAKAASYYATQTGTIESSKDICLGTYVFLWGQKQEVTSTWYGMFLKSGEKLPTVDAMTRAWTGKWPENRCPKITAFNSPLKEAEVKRSQPATATLEVIDPENNPLKLEWKVVEESSDRRVGGDAEAEPPAVPGCIVSQNGNTVKLKTPSKKGAYRLFVVVRDGKGSASADNIPFRVTE